MSVQEVEGGNEELMSILEQIVSQNISDSWKMIIDYLFYGITINFICISLVNLLLIACKVMSMGPNHVEKLEIVPISLQ